MLTDIELLTRYATNRCETAFGELVARHVNLVYSTALRVVGGDAHLAHDVAQSVFIDLARKASRLCSRRFQSDGALEETARAFCLAGWLYTSTRFAGSKAVRAERTRHRYENDVSTMNACEDSVPSESDWPAIRAELDEAMDCLSPLERDAVVLRFFEGRSLRGVGEVLGLGEDAARKRVGRALEKLRDRLSARGVASTTASLAALLAAQAVQAAPAGLTQALTGAVFSATALTTATTPTLLGFMITTKAKLSLTVIALLALTTPLLMQRQTVGELRRQNRLLTDELRAAQVSRQAAVMEATARPSSAVILPSPPNAVKPVWQQVESGNFQEYMANLRGLGMPEQTVRDIVLADVNRLYDEKKRAVLDSIERKDEFWKPGGTSRTAGPSEMDQLRTLAKEKEGLLRDLLGLETDQRDYAKPFNPRDVDDELDWKWTFLTPEKRSLIRDLTIAFRRELPDAPWDEEKHGGLQKQYDENVNQALNPAELEEHQVRHSALTARLQTELQSFQPTEGEFRSIFRLLNDFGRNTPGHLVPPEAYEEDRQTFANPKLRERLQEVLGADRFSHLERTLNTTVPEQ